MRPSRASKASASTFARDATMAAAEAPSPALRAVAATEAACCLMPASPLDPGTQAHAAEPGCAFPSVRTRAGQAAASAAAAAAALLLSPGVSVATPAATTAHAASTPAAAAQQAAEAGAVHALRAAATRDASASPEPGTGAQLAGAAVPAVHADAALMAQHVQSFVRCVARSPLVQSALLSVEVAAAHPPCQLSGDCQLSVAVPVPATSAASSLEHTLAQLLALHVKADRLQACESSLLASLWVLEAHHSADRSLATTCLESYLRLLALFSEELVVRITTDWPGSFRKLRAVLVSAQADLLDRLDWRACLSHEEHVAPAHAWLFGQPAAGAAGGAGAGAPAADAAPWSAAVRSVCTNVRQQAAVFRRCQARDQARAQARESTPDQGASEARPAKRQRTQQA